ncbi:MULTISPECIES: MarR family winged helix-turn-helix transcriptional regulator [Hydrocarboniphaga]|jgi:MarR family transcriptional repressor of emrRAB|uniref:HTH marR-type domain-containing protein n=1 Tax=Hydrocarboniphaga effusa AP103 TaxID=1172194 RepID=I8HXX2_9GAMM|nr:MULTISPECIES: MarR family transcriptional regulator [Hydrocarboniphaga]EIT68296.1 hypothetical protein WQQ_34910 [Hydrocarboniphaga effusa AP103]MDZ4078719.1 MarR family transcriptional regulator [Hydrocarboniphaga sp.]
MSTNDDIDGKGNEDSFSPIEARLRHRRQQLGRLPYERLALMRLLTHLHKRTQEALSVVLAAHGLTPATYEVVMALYDQPDQTLTASELCQASGEKPANLTRICDGLVAAGWIVRKPDDADRRAVRVSLTPAGHEHVSRVQPEVWPVIENLTAMLDAQDVLRLTRLLRPMVARLDSTRAPSRVR